MPEGLALLGALAVAACVSPEPALASSLASTLRCDATLVASDRSTALAEAGACYQQGDVGAAISLYRRWLEACPEDGEARLELARLLTEAGDLAAARDEYDRLIATPGFDTSGVRKARADVMAWRGQLAEAIREYRALLATEPRNAAIQLALGMALRWQGRFDESEVALRAAVATDPGNREAARELEDLLALPAYRASRAERERAADPGSPERWLAAVDALIAAGRFWDAEARVAEALTRWPRDRRLEERRKVVRRKKIEHLRQRLAEVQEGLEKEPGDAELRVEAADLLAALGDLRGAAAQYEAYLTGRPRDAHVRRQLARVLSWAGEYGRALRLYEGLLAESPGDVELHLERARVLSWDGQLTESAREYAMVRDSAPAPAARGLGDVYRWSGHRGVAARHYRAVLLLDGESEDGRAAREFFRTESDTVAAVPTFSLLQDSDDFRLRRVVVKGIERAGALTELAGTFTHSDYEQHGESFGSERLRLRLGREFGGRWRAAATYGPAIYDDQRVSHSYGVSLDRVFGPETTVSLAYDNRDIIDDVLTVASVRDDILDADQLSLTARHVLPGRIQADGRARWASYSDGNRLVAFNLGLRRLLVRRPRLKVGYALDYLAYAERSDRYWDPERYLSQGGLLTIEHRIAGPVRMRVEARVGYGEEEGQGAIERGVSAEIEIVDIWGLAATVGYRYGETGRVAGGGAGYSVQSGSITVRYRLGGS